MSACCALISTGVRAPSCTQLYYCCDLVVHSRDRDSLLSSNKAKSFEGLQRHYFHFKREVFVRALNALTALNVSAYVSAYLTVPRSQADSIWKTLRAELQPQQVVYLAAHSTQLCLRARSTTNLAFLLRRN